MGVARGQTVRVDRRDDTAPPLDTLAPGAEAPADDLHDTGEQDDAARPDDPDDEDIVVLGWWQHPFNIVVMIVTAALVAGMIGWMVADADSGESGNDTDVGFLQDMREHHEQAVAMGFIYLDLPDTDVGLRTIARTIVVGQDIDVGRMIQMLRLMGEDEANPDEIAMEWMGMPVESTAMPGMATQDELDQLGASSGRAADELFVELMRRHHQGGIHMAEFAASNGSNQEVRDMASSMAQSQAHEITELEQQLD